MKQVEAEKLLGGYATGILTEAERKRLFAAALDRQDLFDALMDEEALRVLLADPASKAQLIAALAPAPLKSAQSSKIIPFWRHPGLLSAAAGLILASVAGLAYLRSPDQSPMPLVEEAPKAPSPIVPPKSSSRGPQPPSAGSLETKPPQASPAPPAKAKALVQEEAAPFQRPEALVRAKAVEAQERKAEAKGRPAQEAPVLAPGLVAGVAPGGVIGGVVGGVIGGGTNQPKPARRAEGAGVSGSDGAQASRQDFQRAEARDNMAKQTEAPRPAAAAAVEVLASAGPVSLRPSPAWILAPMADGQTRVTVTTARGLQVLLLRRGAAGVEVLKFQSGKNPQGPGTRWTSLVRLAPGDVLDLYALEGPVPDPARLLETGPVAGFRARIHPAAK